MIFANGKLYETSQQNEILNHLENQINQTRSSGRLEIEKVITALDKFAQELENGIFSEYIQDSFMQSQIAVSAKMLHRNALEYKIRHELGAELYQTRNLTPPESFPQIQERLMPLGTLFHISAGNVDAIPAWSVIEGLLTGNINLLKLPQADNGLTIQFFQHLIQIEPILREYVYIFDTPSSDVAGMKRLSQCADAVIVWGGDTAIQAVRQLAPPECKLIEWGHRLSFCYISGNPENSELTALAQHILKTQQLLCSSCQIIYLDTEDMSQIYQFCEQFLSYLETEAKHFPVKEINAIAEMTLKRYTADLESIMTGNSKQNRIFQGKYCSLTACQDSELELSCLYGNPLVKPLPRNQILSVLRRKKGYLQTAGLICSPESQSILTEILIQSGINRIFPAGKMSDTVLGEAHDGEYPLRRYTRIVNTIK